MQGFCTRCCGVRTSLQHVGYSCSSTALCTVDAAVVHSVGNITSTFIHVCKATDAASVHHRECCLRCKRFAIEVAMLLSSAASAKQYGRRSFALLLRLDAFMRNTYVCGNLHRAVGCTCLMHSLLLAGKFQKAHEPISMNTCSVLISLSLISKLSPHAEYTEYAEWILNTNQANFWKGNVGSRLGATEWTGSLRKCPRIACRKWRKAPDKAS